MSCNEQTVPLCHLYGIQPRDIVFKSALSCQCFISCTLYLHLSLGICNDCQLSRNIVNRGLRGLTELRFGAPTSGTSATYMLTEKCTRPTVLVHGDIVLIAGTTVKALIQVDTWNWVVSIETTTFKFYICWAIPVFWSFWEHTSFLYSGLCGGCL